MFQIAHFLFWGPTGRDRPFCMYSTLWVENMIPAGEFRSTEILLSSKNIMFFCQK